MFKRNLVAVWVGIIVLSGMFLMGQQAWQEVVEFPDPNLEAAVREAIGRPTGDIYASDLLGLGTLNCYNRVIPAIAELTMRHLGLD